jgi:hypothetical protein
MLIISQKFNDLKARSAGAVICLTSAGKTDAQALETEAYKEFFGLLLIQIQRVRPTLSQWLNTSRSSAL